MTSQEFYGSLKCIPIIKKHFHIKLSSNGRKKDCTKKKKQLSSKEKEKRIKAESPDWRRAYIASLSISVLLTIVTRRLSKPFIAAKA